MNWMVPPEYVVLDLETIAGDPTEAEEWMRRAWSPSPKWKPGTIGSRFLDAYEKKQEQLALLDTAPIISVTLHTSADCRVIHWLPCEEPAIAGVPAERCTDQAAMLARVAEYLRVATAETLLVGHNVLRFDLPKLRQAMLRHGVGLPPCLVWRDHPVYDTMREWSRFTLDDRQYVSLSELLEVCGLEDHKQIITGAMVPELYEHGKHREILAYAIADVIAEHKLFLQMTGQTTRQTSPERATAEATAENPWDRDEAACEAQDPQEQPETDSPEEAPQDEEDEGLQRLLKEFQ